MKTLILFRHGRADWIADCQSDHERPLADRGRTAARRMGRFLALAGPDSVLCSTALRARQTLEFAAEAGDWSCTPRFSESLYLDGGQAILDEIRAEPNTADSLLIIGHEPTLLELTRILVDARVHLPTAAMMRIDLAVDSWDDVEPERGSLIWLVPPRLLTGMELPAL